MFSTTAAQTITSPTGTLRCGGKSNSACLVILRQQATARRLSSLEGNVEHHSLDAELVDAVEGRCGKCGSRKHTAAACTADMSRIRCFRCGKTGHISFNCPESREGKGSVRTDTWDKKVVPRKKALKVAKERERKAN